MTIRRPRIRVRIYEPVGSKQGFDQIDDVEFDDDLVLGWRRLKEQMRRWGLL